MTLFRSRSRGKNQFLNLEICHRRKLVSHITFDSTGPEKWSVVACGLVAILVCQGVSSAR